MQGLQKNLLKTLGRWRFLRNLRWMTAVDTVINLMTEVRFIRL